MSVRFCALQNARPGFCIGCNQDPGSARQVSDLALRVRDERSTKDVVYYFFDEGSAPFITLISTTDVRQRGWHIDPDGGIRPHGTASFVGLHTNGRIEQSAPWSGQWAAPIIIIPELGQV